MGKSQDQQRHVGRVPSGARLMRTARPGAETEGGKHRPEAVQARKVAAAIETAQSTGR